MPGVGRDTRVVTRVTLTDVILEPPPSPADRCGLNYVHVRADALSEVDETREDNNQASRRVTLTCNDGQYHCLGIWTHSIGIIITDIMLCEGVN